MKLLEHVTALDQRTSIMSALTFGAVEFSTDVIAYPVVIYCLRYFTKEDTKVRTMFCFPLEYVAT